MKAFWAGILVLVLAAGGLLYARGGGTTEPSTPAAPATGREAVPVRTDSRPAATEAVGVAKTPAPTEAAEAEPAIAMTHADAEAERDAGGSPEIEPAPEEAPESEARGTEAAAAPELEPAIEPESTPEAAPASDPTVEVADAAGGDAAAPALPEGVTLMLDGRHPVTGAGTAESPYVVSWDALIALEQDYAPKKEGLTEIPEWIEVLNGRHVSITGFIAFPFIAPTADECMVMLNEWDGCCIGVPPTPYDAVEVKLAERIDLQQGMINYGTLTGVFRTDPYLVNGWLIGLYVMEEASIGSATGVNRVGY